MRIYNAHHNNLKNIHLIIPENRLILVTGLSGSGKSSLAMEVIANEGYRYFMESLPAFNQQNAQAIPTAEVDAIEELLPVIKVEQSKRFQSINATFGTLTELTQTFRILFARYSAEKSLSKSCFSFNHPKGACEYCRGVGEAEYIDLQKLIADENKTLREGAITTTLPNGYIVYSQITVDELNKVCKAHGFSVDIPWKDLSAEQKDVILNGSERLKVFYGKHSIESRLRWKGLKAKPREEGFYKGILPIMSNILRLDRNPNILKFASSEICPECHGARIKPEYLQYKWQDQDFAGWMDMPLEQLYKTLQVLQLKGGEKALVDQICLELLDLTSLGMGKYSLSTPSFDISSGDGQRIKLVRQVNANLQGILYVFDEPSIGLSGNYQKYLLLIFRRLIDRGNTVMLVEHDLNFIRSADWIIELGPQAGINGGKVLYNGSVEEFLKNKLINSPTLQELKSKNTALPEEPMKQTEGDFQPQKAKLLVISKKTGRALQRLQDYCEEHQRQLQIVSDQPIGKTPRSNPATYTGLADKIRDIFAKTSEAKAKGLSKSAFSFNNKRGRCATCEGAGVITLSMSLMGNINQTCPSCNGKRFKPEILKIHWNNKNISEIYDLSISEALPLFSEEKKITGILSLLEELGLGYIKLGQPSNTLSGGEAQRVKLTKHFAKNSTKTLLVLEEPSIGLHQQNVRQLLHALHRLKKQTAGICCFENHALFQASGDILVENEPVYKAPEIAKTSIKLDDKISIQGARTHHLKNLDFDFPKNKLTVITGISGSGKSSLAIDTLHGYGLQEMTRQFSAYQQSRVGVNFQFEADRIEGLSPTICVTRKERNFTRRSDISKQVGLDKLLRFAYSRKAQYQGEELSASHFSNNHELGKCTICDGYGEEMIPDISKIILEPEKSIADGLLEHNKALAYYGRSGGQYMAILGEVGKSHGFTLKTPFSRLSEGQKQLLFYGTGDKIWKADWNFKTKTRAGTQVVSMTWDGIFNYLKAEYFKTRKNKNIQNLESLLKLAKCGNCSGSGLKPERLRFKIGGKSIHDLKSMDFKTLQNWVSKNKFQKEIDQKLIGKLYSLTANTFKVAEKLHIDHLQLKRKSISLSGGESQRVGLLTQLNSPLKGITYILDEPSAGLSLHNIPDLINLLKDLVAKKNTVIVIEHQKDIILSADHLIQLGPKAGSEGGFLTFTGTPQDFMNQENVHPFFKLGDTDFKLKKSDEVIMIQGISRFTLKKKFLEIPIGGITALSGRSGVGKTTLVKDIIIPSLTKQKPVNCDRIEFPKPFKKAFYFESKPLRAYSETLLVSYLDLLKGICKLFAKGSHWKPRDFSYKTKSSQCPNCQGKGFVETSLDVTANAREICEICHGKRYKKELLEHYLGSKNIAEVLSLNVSDFKSWLVSVNAAEGMCEKIDYFEEIGLDHLKMEQPVKSLSSGEKQRLQLLNWIEETAEDTLFILDEPSVGLHLEDIDLLYEILKRLGNKNDVLVIDHNPYLLRKIGIGTVLQ
ncbi:MAG: excinuclease ABC subunit A [Christiangramia sp.]